MDEDVLCRQLSINQPLHSLILQFSKLLKRSQNAPFWSIPKICCLFFLGATHMWPPLATPIGLDEPKAPVVIPTKHDASLLTLEMLIWYSDDFGGRHLTLCNEKSKVWCSTSHRILYIEPHRCPLKKSFSSPLLESTVGTNTLWLGAWRSWTLFWSS